jgi:hypothetical protein
MGPGNECRDDSLEGGRSRVSCVISDEIIPETHRKGFENHGTAGLMVGLVVMMFLDVVLG